MSSLREDQVCVPRLNALKLLQWGMQEEWKEVGEWRGTTRMKDLRVCPLGRAPWLPLYRVQGQATYKEIGSLD
jgi:hypothetical protein